MARIRSIKPDFFCNEGLATISEAAQLLAAGLLCYADDEGYFNAHPGLVKAAVFPLREPLESIESCMAALVKIGYIQLGTGIDCKRYGHIVKFLDHQRVSHPIPSKIKPMRVVWEVSREIPEDSVKAPEVRRHELNGIELNGNRRELEKPSSRSASTGTIFPKAYEQYPRHVGKRAASKAWDSAVNRHRYKVPAMCAPIDIWDAEDFIYQKVMTYAAVCKRYHKPREFIPHMATWLNQDRFLDDPSEWSVAEGTHGSTSKAAEKLNRNREAIVSGLTGQGDWSDAGHNQPNVQRSGVNAGAGVVLEGSTQRVKPATNT